MKPHVMNVKTSKLRRLLRKNGFNMLRNTSGHEIWNAPVSGATFSIALGGKKNADPAAVKEVHKYIKEEQLLRMQNEEYMTQEQLPTDLVTLVEASKIVGRGDTWAWNLAKQGLIQTYGGPGVHAHAGKLVKHVSLADVQQYCQANNVVPYDPKSKKQPPVVLTPEPPEPVAEATPTDLVSMNRANNAVNRASSFVSKAIKKGKLQVWFNDDGKKCVSLADVQALDAKSPRKPKVTAYNPAVPKKAAPPPQAEFVAAARVPSSRSSLDEAILNLRIAMETANVDSVTIKDGKVRLERRVVEEFEL